MIPLTFLCVATSQAMLPTPQPQQPAGGQLAAQKKAEGISPVISAFLVSDVALTPITPTTQIRSKDVIEYHAYLPNRSPDRIRSMTVTLEIPQGVTFAHNVSPLGATASVDNINFGKIPLQTNYQGQLQNVPDPLYRSLRWVIEDVGVNGVAVVKYRALVN